ncbi:MAG TPA: ergothioneine biosynthesis protein EgtB [Gammaproteobacteria bacterium]|nr:ergothioneine biosynthesis protein EgtB [Gammaproteobacteria bacterium]
MTTAAHSRPTDTGSASLAQHYQAVRAVSADLCRTLTPEDMTVQSMPDASPAKWHLAHTTWFFERFLLTEHLPGYRVFHPQFDYLFNSYYNTVGKMHPRPQRGLVTRPGVAEILGYRQHVDAAMPVLLERAEREPELAFLIALGLNHEQQHQELLLTDIKHLLSLNPLLPAWRELVPPARAEAAALKYIGRPEGLVQIGHHGKGFAFDNESPRHRVFMQAHALANRPVSNGEYLAFIRDGGYRTPELWLSDGWGIVQQRGWERPLYWNAELDAEFTLGGLRELDQAAPVTHISYYEADAFARWAGARLPTEAEWETLAAEQTITGNFMEQGHYHPAAMSAGSKSPHQLFGDVWEWTASPYVSYPGFKPLAGSLGEYNGKFMSGQMVLRGGSCVTPQSHLRASYRNFFPPDARWQFSGLRLARDE